MRLRRRTGPGRPRRTWGQRLTLALSTGIVLGLVATAGGIGYSYTKYSRLARIQLGSVLTERSSSTEAQNILLVGVDSAAALDPDNPVRNGRETLGGLRSDTMMVLRVEPGSGQARLLSLPRDLWVPLASGGRQRINTAIQIGGPANLIDTIEEYLGIPINHYVQVDFAGFRDLVDVIGGVEVWFDDPTRDRQSGLDVPESGCISLGPDQALAYVRARHLQFQDDGRWRTDGTGDLGRMSRQQDFIIRALRRAVDRGVRNPVTLDNLVDAALETVTVDDLFTAEGIVELATQFRSFQPDRLERHALPVVDGSAGGAAILRLIEEDAQPVLDLFRGPGAAPPAVTDESGTSTTATTLVPGEVRVQVLNGSGVNGEAGELADDLEAIGFDLVESDEADSFGYEQPVVRYRSGGEDKASLVAAHISPRPRLERVSSDLDVDVVVITGGALVGVTRLPPIGDEATDTTEPASVTTSTSTSTTIVGKVPEPPSGSGC